MVAVKSRGHDLPTPSDLWVKDASGDYDWRSVVPGTDVRVVTSAGRAIEAHSTVLSAASPVLEARLFGRPPKRHHDGSAILPIRGVPCDAVLSFIRCLYAGKITASSPDAADVSSTNDNNHAVHLLVLSHALRVPWLKRAAESALAATLQAEDVADLLQLARLCDAGKLKVACLGYVRRDPAAVEATDGWMLLRRCNPRMEAEVLRFVKESERREERRRKRREENRAYVELGDAVECLHHILRQEYCGVGGGVVAPKDRGSTGKTTSCGCQWQQTCEGLRALIRHYAACQDRQTSSGAGCRKCCHMVQLLRLHAAISYELDHPMPSPLSSALCTLKTVEEEDAIWRLLARKVVSAKLMSALAISKKQREEAAGHYQGRPAVQRRFMEKPGRDTRLAYPTRQSAVVLWC